MPLWTPRRVPETRGGEPRRHDADRDDRHRPISRRGVRRLRIDARLAIGVALVLGSIVGVYALVQAADSTTRVYTARNAISPGDTVRAADLQLADVRLGAATGHYLLAGQLPAAGALAAQPVAAGELVPLSSLAEVAGEHETSVVVTVGGPLAEAVRPGSIVDVWSARSGEQHRFGPPGVLVDGATVVQVNDLDGLVARGGPAVELRVPKSSVPAALEAIANGDAISLVPVHRPLRP